jgi:excisionase family DNA binding protein
MPRKTAIKTTPPAENRFCARISYAAEISGLSEATLYRLLAEGRITAKKSGRSTLILVDSLRAHIESLPRAVYR